MKNLPAISHNLFEKLRNQFQEISLGDENAQTTSDPSEARFFNFSFSTNNSDYGNITISVADGKSLKIYFTRNISSNMPATDRKIWYAFLKDLRFFALRNFLTFDTRDITRNQLTQKDLANSSKLHAKKYSIADVAEGKMYGSSKRSYQKFGEAKILVKHLTPINPEVKGSRSRQIESIFIETSEGERFKLPFISLNGARAMANHFRHGGMLNDSIGRYITDVVNEMSNLRGFVRCARSVMLEDETQTQLVNSAIDYYGELHDHLHNLKGPRTYKKFTETFKPIHGLTEEKHDLEIAEIFEKTPLAQHIESALPALARMKARENKIIENQATIEFEQWLDSIVESSNMDIDKDKLNELMSKPINFGSNASNVIASIGSLLNDEDFNEFIVLEFGSNDNIDEQTDARELIFDWLSSNMPELASNIDTKNFDSTNSDTETNETINRYDFQGGFVDGVEADNAEYADDYEDKLKLSPINRIAKLAGLSKR